MKLLDLLQDSLEFRAGLEWRIDEDQPAPFLRRQHGFQRRIAVDFMHLGALGFVEEVAKARAILGVEFAKTQAILRP